MRPEDFERVVAESLRKATELPGVAVTFLKGDRGGRAGRYVAVFEIESTAVRDRYWPTPTESSPEAKAWAARWAGRFPELAVRTTFTDYVPLGTWAEGDGRDCR